MYKQKYVVVPPRGSPEREEAAKRVVTRELARRSLDPEQLIQDLVTITHIQISGYEPPREVGGVERPLSRDRASHLAAASQNIERLLKKVLPDLAPMAPEEDKTPETKRLSTQELVAMVARATGLGPQLVVNNLAGGQKTPKQKTPKQKTPKQKTPKQKTPAQQDPGGDDDISFL